MAVTIVLALAACTPAEDTPDDEANTPTAALVADAIGAGIDTQDFHVIGDLAAIGEDGEATSFLDQVLERADDGRGEPVALDDGLVTFTPTDSLEGAIVEDGGEVVPGAEIGFGLLELSAEGLDLAAEVFSAADPSGESPPDFRAGSLVIYSTTDLDGTATHIGTGDRFELDLTFVDGLDAGDTIRQTMAFAQALRLPDASADSGDPDEVFGRRLAGGSYQALGGSMEDGALGLQVMTIEGTAVEGSVK